MGAGEQTIETEELSTGTLRHSRRRAAQTTTATI